MDLQKVRLDKKKFRVLSNSERGEVSENTIFHYHQHGNIIWAAYGGGDIQTGHLLGKVLDNKSFEFAYHHINLDNEVLTGKCQTTISYNENGKIVLSEKWQWTCKDMSRGESELVEC